MFASRGIRFQPALLIASVLSAILCACDAEPAREIVRETGTYADGSPAWERGYLRAPDGRKVPHGPHATWHPGGGPRQTLEFFDHGLRQGYSFEWDARGELVRLAQCEDGFCAGRALPPNSTEAARALATLRLTKPGVASGLRIASAR